jgi:sugar O-acyltransferase (sialic acid O-acetyltransferase NeuD family)
MSSMGKNKELYILGAGGLAREIAQLARKIDPYFKRWEKFIYVADNKGDLGKTLLFGSVELLDEELLGINRNIDVVIGTGLPHLRRSISDKFVSNSNFSFPNLIHPSIEIDRALVELGRGNIITQGVVMTCGIKICDFNLFNWNSTIGHDTFIGSFNVINPGASISGNIRLGSECLIGTGSRVLENLHISSGVIVGAGAVVIRSIDSPGIYVGVPATLI